MEDEKPKPLSYLDRLKLKANSQVFYGGETKIEEAKIGAITCKNCGAGRAYNDGLTHCGYCGFEFLAITLTDGLHIKKENNSKH